MLGGQFLMMAVFHQGSQEILEIPVDKISVWPRRSKRTRWTRGTRMTSWNREGR